MADPAEERHKRRQQRFTHENHTFQKRLPYRFEVDDAVIYVSTNTHIKALMRKCEKLINENEEELILYGLGAAIPKAILLALQLCDKYPAYKSSTQTLTIQLLDDLVPTNNDADYETLLRNNSALRIRVFRVDLLDINPKPQPTTSTS